MSFLVMACIVIFNLADRANVYIDTDSKHIISVDASRIGRPLDVAYDKARDLLYVYSILPDGQHVTRWASSGRVVADWRLPWKDPTPCALCLFRGQAVLQSWDSEKQSNEDLLFPNQGSEQFTIGDLGSHYALSPKAVESVTQIREIMLNQHWDPFAHIGVHVGDSDTLIKDFVATNPYRDERIAWTPDYSVLSYSWDNGLSFHLAVKDRRGGYTDRDLFKNIVSALDWSPGPTNQLYLYSISVNQITAAYGLQIDHAKPDHEVVWIDLTTPNWRIIRTEAGYLARKLTDIGY